MTPTSKKQNDLSLTPAPQADEKVIPAKGKRILIVEDERPLSHALEMKLGHEGYETRVVTNGTDALTALEKDRFHMILLDLIMPVMDGFAVLAALKARKNTVPVIVLSNLGQTEDQAKTKELGAADYFVKSNTPIADIVARVKTIL